MQDFLIRLLELDPQAIHTALGIGAAVPGNIYAAWKTLGWVASKLPRRKPWQPGVTAAPILEMLWEHGSWTLTGDSVINNGTVGVMVDVGQVFVGTDNVTADLTRRERKAIVAVAQEWRVSLLEEREQRRKKSIADALLDAQTRPEQPYDVRQDNK